MVNQLHARLGHERLHLSADTPGSDAQMVGTLAGHHYWTRRVERSHVHVLGDAAAKDDMGNEDLLARRYPDAAFDSVAHLLVVDEYIGDRVPPE